MKVYLASSWRNPIHSTVLAALREDEHEVYDFKNPPGGTGFAWKQAGSVETPADYLETLTTERARAGFAEDMGALKACDACVLLLPCGRSAHLEAGWAAGAGKRVLVLIDNLSISSPGHSMGSWACAACGDLDGCNEPTKRREKFEPELMYLMCEMVTCSLKHVREALRS